MSELKMTGNCLRGSRPLLSFDQVSSLQLMFSVLESQYWYYQYNNNLSTSVILMSFVQTCLIFIWQDFDKEPHWRLLKELIIQVGRKTKKLLSHRIWNVQYFLTVFLHDKGQTKWTWLLTSLMEGSNSCLYIYQLVQVYLRVEW